jgi:hypothetical protein
LNQTFPFVLFVVRRLLEDVMTERVRRARSAMLALAAVVLFVGVATSVAADDDGPAWAYVENQRNEIVILQYSQVTSTASSTSILEVYPGRTQRFDVNKLDGDVCAAVEDDPNPAKSLGCRTLTPGQRWVIY